MPHRRCLASAAVLLAATLATARPAACETVLKLATLVPEGSVWDRALRTMGEEWKRASGGQIILRLYPGGVAGDDADIVRKMRIGQLQGGAVTVGGLAQIDDAFNALAVPLFFDSYDELFAVLAATEPLFRERLERAGFVLLNWGHGGWVHFFSKRPVATVEDLRGQKMYTWAGDQRMVEWWKRGGFQPVPLAMTDVLTALQTGMIDALPSTPLAALSLQWFRQTPYMHDLGLAPVVGATILTRRGWESIPEGQRQAVLAAARQSGDRLGAEIPRQDEAAVAEMRQRGLTVTPSRERQVWQAEAERFAASMRGGIVPLDVFDQVRATRDAYRSRPASGGVD